MKLYLNPVFSTFASDSVSLAFWACTYKAGSIQILFLRLRPLQTTTHCCRHIVADTNVSPFARVRNICCGHKFCVRHTKIVSDFVQKHFVSATNVSQFAQLKKHHGQQCVHNNVSTTMCPRLPGPLVSSFVDPISPLLLRRVTHKAILYSRHDNQGKSPSMPGAAIKFAGIRLVCLFPRFSPLITC